MTSAHVAHVSHDGLHSNDKARILTIYSSRVFDLQADLNAAQSVRMRSLLLLIGCVCIAALVIGVALTHNSILLVWSTAPFLAGCDALRRYIRSGEQWRQIEKRRDYFERGIRRLTGAWQEDGRTGEEFAREKHLYQHDLNVIGNNSLFELLCTTRSELGAEKLADYLLEPTSLDESRLRQEAVSELRDKAHLREEMDLLGDYRSEDVGYSHFEEWLELPPIISSLAIRRSLLFLSACVLTIGLGIFSHVLSLSGWFPVVVAAIVIHTCAAGVYVRRVRPRLAQLRRLTNAFTILHQGLALLEKQEFSSPKLQELVSCVRSQNASCHLRTLERLVRLVEQREKEFFHYLSYLVAMGTQLVLATDHWRGMHQQHFRGWIEAWAELDALQALAGYAYEQPGVVFPELVDGESVFEAADLGHPLLSPSHRVSNDIALNGQSPFYLITGSNMAGKSTILRTIGLNAVIAFAGGPVQASCARLSHLAVCASLAASDSLMEGKSKFLAEIARLAATVSMVRSGRPILFLIDEMLSGTNSRDRAQAAESILRILLGSGAIGAISTHDLALASLLDNPALAGALVHMESENEEDPLDFDYLLKPGVSKNSSAQAIIRMVGISVH